MPTFSQAEILRVVDLFPRADPISWGRRSSLQQVNTLCQGATCYKAFIAGTHLKRQ